MRLSFAAALLLVVIAPAFAQDEMVTLRADQYGSIFCMARLGNDMGPVTGILTPELTAAIAEAEAKDDAWEKANPGDKPPLGDGVPWQSFQDYAPECEVGNVTVNMDNGAEVELRYGFPDSPDADFSDTLLLRSVPDEFGTPHWRIDNIRYADGSDLLAFLVEVFDVEGA